MNLMGQWEVAFSEISYSSMYQDVTEGTFMFFDKKLPKSSESFYLEPGVYPCITDNVAAMNILIKGKHNHNENWVTIQVS